MEHACWFPTLAEVEVISTFGCYTRPKKKKKKAIKFIQCTSMIDCMLV